MASKKFQMDRMQDLEKAFKMFDKNQDGKIDKDELRTVFKEANVEFTEEQLTEFMRRVDLDGNGSIDYTEFCVIMKDMVGQALEFEMKVNAAFCAMDADGDGQISQSELQKALADIGEPISDEEAKEIIRVVDRNGDQHIDYQEFITMMYILNME